MKVLKKIPLPIEAIKHLTREDLNRLFPNALTQFTYHAELDTTKEKAK